jgi:hypothetical protein
VEPSGAAQSHCRQIGHAMVRASGPQLSTSRRPGHISAPRSGRAADLTQRDLFRDSRRQGSRMANQLEGGLGLSLLNVQVTSTLGLPCEAKPVSVSDAVRRQLLP